MHPAARITASAPRVMATSPWLDPKKPNASAVCVRDAFKALQYTRAAGDRVEMSDQGASREVAPCFVGGSPRSGTTILGRLIGQHSSYGLVPHEAKFHSHPAAREGDLRQRPPSLLDLLTGQATIDSFASALRGHWYDFTVRKRKKRGLKRFVAPDVFEAAVEAFQRRGAADPWAASGELMDTLFSTVAPTRGAWVEMSPSNIPAADLLGRCLPSARFVHIVRDGRDVASSMLSQPWGQDTWEGALKVWRSAVRRSEDACSELGSARTHLVYFEDLISRARESSYRALLDFLELEDEPAMRDFFETQMDGTKAHTGRWRDGLERSEVERRERDYRGALERLASGRPGGIGSVLKSRLD